MKNGKKYQHVSPSMFIRQLFFICSSSLNYFCFSPFPGIIINFLAFWEKQCANISSLSWCHQHGILYVPVHWNISHAAFCASTFRSLSFSWIIINWSDCGGTLSLEISTGIWMVLSDPVSYPFIYNCWSVWLQYPWNVFLRHAINVIHYLSIHRRASPRMGKTWWPCGCNRNQYRMRLRNGMIVGLNVQ